MMKTLALLSASLALAVAAGCTKPPQPKTGASDAVLTEKVKVALANEAGLKTLKLDVDANSGVVSLKGQVENDETKQRIQEVARAVPGVTWVQNQLSVAPKPS